MRTAIIVIVSIVVIAGIGTIVYVSSHSSKTAANIKTTAPAVAANEKCPVTPGGSNVTELQSTDQTVGTGTAATASSSVTVKYTGCLSDGTVFDSTEKDGGQPATFPLSGVIAGWQQGIPGMKVGGTRTLVIPGNLAYGANPPQGSGIPANATLTFQIELLAVK